MTLGWVLYAVLLGALFGAAAACAESALAAFRKPGRGAWTASLAASVLVPIGAYFVPAPTPHATAALLSPWPLFMPMESGGGISLLARLQPAFPILWGVGSTILLTWLAWSYDRFRRARRTWPVRRLHDVEVLESPAVGPAVIGILWTRIAVPRWIDELDHDLQRLALLHEQEHQRRRDPLLLWGAWIACALAPWNLALWWQLRRLRTAIEVDCDRRVLERGAPIARYGDLLLEVGQRLTARPRLALALFETRSFLERRIHVMTSRPPRRAPRAFGAILAVTLVVAFVVELVPPARLAEANALSNGDPAVPALAIAPADTPPAFTFTPYTVKPRCIEGCTTERLQEFLSDAPTCHVTIGILIDTHGSVTATDVLKPGGASCENGARSWAMTTRWTPAELDGRAVPVWLAQPILYEREESSGPGL